MHQRFVFTRCSRAFSEAILLFLAASLIVLAQGCTRNSDVDPKAAPIPSSRQAK